MAIETRLEGAVEQLNAALGDVTPYRLAVVNPNNVYHVEKNAHYMPSRTYRRLVDNIKRDGNLSSLPFCWNSKDGKIVALSGNHRIDAARDAGIEQILVLYTDKEMTRSEQVAVQLSHNAIVGTDNKQILRELWDEIFDMEYKQYTGLDETTLETVDAASLDRLRVQSLPLEMVQFLFLPEEIERLDSVVKALEKVAKPDYVRYAGRREDFDRFLDAVLKFKEAEGIISTPTAILRMVEVIEEYLAAKAEG